MKTAVITTIVVSLASAVVAAPTSPMQPREEQAANGLFDGFFGHGDGSNIFSNIFDGAACVVSSVIGGGNPKCQGKGQAVVEVPNGDKGNSNNGSKNTSTQYTYKYDTNQDGTLKVDVTLERGGSCTFNEKADGRDIKQVIASAAEKCLNKN